MPRNPAGSRPTVLIVDDDPDVRDSTAAMLHQGGFGVLTAENSAQAIMLCRTQETPVDLLLTDLEMPGVSGSELARAVSALAPAPDIVYMSGIPRDIVLSRGLINDRATLIAKPFTKAVLIQTLSSVLALDPGGPQSAASAVGAHVSRLWPGRNGRRGGGRHSSG